jgi:hypothetical protein
VGNRVVLRGEVRGSVASKAFPGDAGWSFWERALRNVTSFVNKKNQCSVLREGRARARTRARTSPLLQETERQLQMLCARCQGVVQVDEMSKIIFKSQVADKEKRLVGGAPNNVCV